MVQLIFGGGPCCSGDLVSDSPVVAASVVEAVVGDYEILEGRHAVEGMGEYLL